MYVWQVLCSCLLYLIGSAVKAECPLRCSRVLDPTCALLAIGAASDVRLYQNACHLHKIQCLLKQDYEVVVKQLPGSFCGIENLETENTLDTRRFDDNSIVGARSLCNHTCPTHCTDIYDPVCAIIVDIVEKKNREKHILINHCHADMLSCTLQQTIQILNVDGCFGMIAAMGYTALAQAATMKGLGLIDA